MRTNTNELRKQLRSLLLSKCSNVNYEQTPSSTKGPYVVFSLMQTLEDSGRNQYTLEINCVSRDPEEVEELADSIQDLMHNAIYENNKLSLNCYKSQRNTVFEEDKSIKRRRLIFQLDVYYKEV